jgi:hypothetical protein
VWHNKLREQGGVPHRAIDPAAGWSKAGWHGWWSGWQLHLAVTVGAVWIPVAAELTVAHRGEHAIAPLLLELRPWEVRDVLGDTHDPAPERRRRCQAQGCDLVATRRGPHPHRDGGADVRKLFHKLRSHALDPCKGWFKHIVEWRVKMPVKGLQRSQLLALGAVVVYQVVGRYQHAHNLPLGKGIQPVLRAT